MQAENIGGNQPKRCLGPSLQAHSHFLEPHSLPFSLHPDALRLFSILPSVLQSPQSSHLSSTTHPPTCTLMPYQPLAAYTGSDPLLLSLIVKVGLSPMPQLSVVWRPLTLHPDSCLPASFKPQPDLLGLLIFCLLCWICLPVWAAFVALTLSDYSLNLWTAIHKSLNCIGLPCCLAFGSFSLFPCSQQP